MEPARPSRIEEAKHRASRAKTALGAGAAVAFAAAAGLAWSSHSGAAAAPAAAVSTSDDGSSYYSNNDGGFDYGSGSVSPSTGSQPQVGTSVS